MKKEIVYTDKYALILDIEKDIEENMFTLKDGKIREVSYLGQDNGNAIIAHLPLSDAPILEGVPLLPPLPSRPTHFECEVMCGRCRSIDDECWSAKECSRGYDYPDIMRTTTNSQGHIELVGKYLNL